MTKIKQTQKITEQRKKERERVYKPRATCPTRTNTSRTAFLKVGSITSLTNVFVTSGYNRGSCALNCTLPKSIISERTDELLRAGREDVRALPRIDKILVRSRYTPVSTPRCSVLEFRDSVIHSSSTRRVRGYSRNECEVSFNHLKEVEGEMKPHGAKTSTTSARFCMASG